MGLCFPVTITEGEGTLEINLTEYDTIINLFLEDVVTGNIIPITNNTDYYFLNTSLDFNHRFNILFDNPTTIDEINYPIEVSVDGVDVLGRKVTKEYKGIKIDIRH